MVGNDPAVALQTAIYTALLAASPALTVYDHVPDDAAFPYVTIGDDTAVDDGTKGKAGHEITLTLHTWSRYRGRFEAWEMLDQIYVGLHRQALAVSGFTLVTLQNVFSDVFDDPDGLTMHGVARYRAVLENE